jgi:hypothetical protein
MSFLPFNLGRIVSPHIRSLVLNLRMSLPVSMHAGQIILLTKLLANKDLGFYDFSIGNPAYLE